MEPVPSAFFDDLEHGSRAGAPLTRARSAEQRLRELARVEGLQVLELSPTPTK